ncbi:MAG: replicative DNA helicase, partial [Burkholderiaceae bacterium]|nr:replicative DNA helicase [Burkholderiaceae bacterium]
MAEELEKTETVRLPPHSTEAEQGLLGSLLIDNRVYDMVNDVVQAEDFYRGDHRRIYEHISNLITSGRPADVLTVHDSMVSVGLGQEGTKSFLNSLAMNTPNSANARRYAEIVRDRSILRSLVSAGSAIVDSALDTKGLETKDILDMAEKAVFGISEQAQTANEGLKPVKNALIAVNDQVTKLFNSKSS